MYFDLKNKVCDYSSPDMIVMIKLRINQHYYIWCLSLLCAPIAVQCALLSLSNPSDLTIKYDI